MELVTLSSLTRTERSRTLGYILIRNIHTEEQFEVLLSALEPLYVYLANYLKETSSGIANCNYSTDTPENRQRRMAGSSVDLDNNSYHSYLSKLKTNIQSGNISDYEDSFHDTCVQLHNGGNRDLRLPCDESERNRTQLREHSLLQIRNLAKHFSRRPFANACRTTKPSPLPHLLPPSNFGEPYASACHRTLFNRLSATVGACNWMMFHRQLCDFDDRLSRDADAACIALYLEASCSIFQSKFDECRQKVREGFELTPYTKTPNRFTVKLLSLEIWVELKDTRQQGVIASKLGLQHILSFTVPEPLHYLN